ncbi:MAG: glycosyltransferase [Coriobacteriales bacterium]|jgi:CDP-glycerol glycerophosphotransferase
MKSKNNKKTIYDKYTDLYSVYYSKPIDESAVYLESRDGADFTGNIFRIAQELCSNSQYSNLHLYIRLKDEVVNKFLSLIDNYNFDKTKIEYTTDTWTAIKWMEVSKYIVTDSGMPWEYVKRQGQIILNTWHGTPLKVMGRFIPTEEHKIGTVQHLFLSSDYLLYPSYYMKNTMLQSYMVEKVASGHALMAGYPRNAVFFSHERRVEVRKELGFGDNKIYAYMPTHRGNSVHGKNSSQLHDVIDYLSYLDCFLNDDEILLVKLHVYNQSKIDFRQFDHVKPFPEGYETYDVLNATDCLVTDYSSVLFDYANSRNKIILFAYDQEEYFQDRGTYFSLDELPFPTVSTAKDLLKELRSPKQYDDNDFLLRYCTFDNIDATSNLCRHVFLGENNCKEEEIYNGKENVLIFAGNLSKNGITTACISLLNNLDKDRRNYFLAFRRQDIDVDPSRMKVIPTDVEYLPMMSDQMYTTDEMAAYSKYSQETNIDCEYPNNLKRLFKREWDRYYWGIKFSNIIQFDGYGKNVSLLFDEVDANKTIFVHNDMIKEAQRRHIQHLPTLRRVYNSYDHVAVVAKELVPSVEQISGRSDNIIVIENIQDYNKIIEKSNKQIEFDDDTILKCWTPYGLYDFFNTEGCKIVTVGRFSPEKGHLRLIDAFDRFNQDHPDSRLLIIGGHGNLYNDTIKHALTKRSHKNIYILKSISNPMPILKRCDLFVLPSFYEGQPMVIQEADICGLPVVSTDIPGPHEFLAKHGGTLVEDSEDGILSGLNMYVNGRVSKMSIDYETTNARTLRTIEKILGE